MSLFLRRLVSGRKARFRDDQLNLELGTFHPRDCPLKCILHILEKDLAYVTDQIIVMSFPAVGVESIYRNHRADVQRFLSTHHGAEFWVFNFCPLTENSYPESVFDGRVSRYPFPDHHVPPFSYLSLVTREMYAWLSGSDRRVAVLHCKAGKGRSGTLACAYLLTLRAPPSASISSSGHESLSAWSLIGDREGLQTPPEEKSAVSPAIVGHPSPCPPLLPGADLSRVSSEPVANTLEQVLNLHTSRRMKSSLLSSRYRPTVPSTKKPKMGVSIPSQQRWLSYWSHVLAGKGPLSLQPFQVKDHPEAPSTPQTAKIKLTELRVRMHEPSRMQSHLVQAASVVITGAGKGRAVGESTTGELWASLARYSDRLVDELEQWKNKSRTTAGMIDPSPFRNDRWDKAKMVRSFSHMSLSEVQPSQQGESKPAWTYVLLPVDRSEGGWVNLHAPVPEPNREKPQQEMSILEGPSCVSVPDQVGEEDLSGIVLDANRELQIKLFLGEIALGWVWLIPAFHMSPDSLSSSLVLSSDNIDFAIGPGKALVDMKISFARCGGACDHVS